MIRTRAAASCWFSFTIALIPLLAAPMTARAQAPALPSVDNKIKTAGDVSGYRAQIDQFVELAAAQLSSGTSDQQGKARDALRSAALLNGQPTASPAYLAAYAQTVNNRLLALLQTADTNMRVRLNAGIVATSVAQAANNPQLAPTAAALMKDASPAVALWGVKAARYVLSAQLRGIGGKGELIDAIIPAVEKHATGQIGGAIAYDAYLALTIDFLGEEQRTKPSAASLKTVAPYVQKLLESRLKHYRKGVPPSARAEARATSFLSNGQVWGQLGAPEKLSIMQDFCDLVGLAGEQAKQANAGDRGDLSFVIARAAAAISIIADPTNAGPVALQIQPATKLGPQASVAQIETAIKAVLPAVKTVATFKDLKPPPAVIAHEAAPPPASAPTTGPVVIPGAGGLPTTAPNGAAPTTRAAPAPPGLEATTNPQ